MREKQLTLFDMPKTPYDDLFKYIAELKDSHRRTQKKLFAEINDLNKRLLEANANHDKLLFRLGMLDNQFIEKGT